MTTILCYGDSNTFGVDPATQERHPRDVRWPGVLRAALGPGFEVIEEGLNGRTTLWDDPFEPGRRGLDYLLPCLRSHRPLDLVVVMLGTNDLKPIHRLTPAAIAAGAGTIVETILGSAAGPGAGAPQVLLVAPPPLRLSPGRAEVWGFEPPAEAASRELARYYRIVAEELGCGFLDAGEHGAASPDDGVHLDAATHAALGVAVADRVRGAFPRG